MKAVTTLTPPQNVIDPTARALDPACLDEGRPPPNVRLVGATIRDGHTVEEIEFDGAHGATVTGYRVAQPLRGLRPAILLAHHASGDKATMLPEAKWYASIGYVALAIDAPHRRPAPHTIASDNRTVAGFERNHRQQLGDLRRAIDVVETDETVDRYRIGFVGRNEGGMLAGALTSADERIRAAVTMAALPSQSTYLATSTLPRPSGFRARIGPDVLTKISASIAPFDLMESLAKTNTPHWLFQFGDDDERIDPDAVERLRDMAPLGSRFETYDIGADLQHSSADRHRRDFIREYLG